MDDTTTISLSVNGSLSNMSTTLSRAIKTHQERVNAALSRADDSSLSRVEQEGDEGTKAS